MGSLLGYRWKDTISYFGNGNKKDDANPISHDFDYGLFDQAAFQNSLLEKCSGLSWFIESAEKMEGELAVLTCGEHEGRRGVNRIIENTMKAQKKENPV